MNSDPKLEVQRQRLSSVVAVDLLPSLEGVELGAYGKVNVWYIEIHRNPGTVLSLTFILPPQTVSYAQFLYPTNALVRQKGGGATDNCTAHTPQSRLRGNGQKNFTPARLNSGVAQDPGMTPAWAPWHTLTHSCPCTVSLTIDVIVHFALSAFQARRRWQSTTPTCSVTLSGRVGGTRGFLYLHHTWWAGLLFSFFLNHHLIST